MADSTMASADQLELHYKSIKCPMCKQHKHLSECTKKRGPNNRSEDNLFICKGCNAIKSRVARIVDKRSEAMQDFGYDIMTADKRQTFFRECTQLYGDALEVKMQEVITEITKQSYNVSFTGTGEFYDKEDIELKYASKPEILKNILANARTFEDPDKKCTMYEDMKYTSSYVDKEERNRELKRQVCAGFKGKGKGKAIEGGACVSLDNGQLQLLNIPAHTEAPEPDDNAHQRKLNRSHQKKIKIALEAAKPLMSDAAGLIPTAKEMPELVPRFVVEQLQLHVKSFQDTLPTIEARVRSGKHQDPDAFVLKVQKLATNIVECHEKLAGLVADAEKYQQGMIVGGA